VMISNCSLIIALVALNRGAAKVAKQPCHVNSSLGNSL